MEAKAIELFKRFSHVTILYRTDNGEYFIELDDCQAYLITRGTGSYIPINRVDPLPEVPGPLENAPIWVLINEPLSINQGLGFDGCISFSTHNLDTAGEEVHTVNRTGAFSVGHFVLVKARTAPFRAKYGQIVAIEQNNLTVNVMKVYGEDENPITNWQIILTAEIITSYEIAVKEGYEGTPQEWVNDAINAYQKAEAARDIAVAKATEATEAAEGLAAAVAAASSSASSAATKATEVAGHADNLQAAAESAEENAQVAVTSANTAVENALEATNAAASAVNAKDSAESYLSGLLAINGDLGVYNASTNTPPLSATPSPGLANGKYYTVTVQGAVGFAGNNFAAGDTLFVGDKLIKLNTQWYLQSNRPVGEVKGGDTRGVIGDVVYREVARFSSRQYNCFEKYKQSDSDILFSFSGYPTGGTVLASAYYRAVISLRLTGFDVSKKHKLSLMRRGKFSNTIFDYSIIIASWDGAEWARTAYFIINNNIEINPNGINLVESTLGNGKKIEALIDYSFIPENSSAFIGGTEGSEPNFIIKTECFYTPEEVLKPGDVFDNGFYRLEKTKFVIEGVNKFNGNAVIGFYINTSGVKYQNTADAFSAISKDIPVPEGATHIATQGFAKNSSYTIKARVSCMDVNKVVLGGVIPDDNYIAQLLPGTKYVCVGLARNINLVPNPDWSSTLIAFSAVQPKYEPYKRIIDPDYIEIQTPQEVIDRLTRVEDFVDFDLREQYRIQFAGGDYPVSTDGAGIKAGYVYIEQSTNYLKVK